MRIKGYLNKLIAFIRHVPLSLWVVAIIGLISRILGIWYGLPLALNVDEPSIVSTAFKLKHTLNPGRFDWPHLYFYINAVFYAIFSMARHIIGIFLNLPESWYTPSPFFLVSRLVTVMFGVLTIFALYYLAKIVFENEKIALISAIILSILPIHVHESHWAKLDVAQTFFVTLALIFIYKVYLNVNRRDFVLSGVFIGLATSIKYNGFLLYFVLILAFLLHYKRNVRAWVEKENILNFIYAGISSIVVFFLGTPYALIDHKLFLSHEYGKGVLWQFQNIGKVPWPQYPVELFETFFVMYKTDLGIFLWLIFILLIILFLFFNKRDDKTVLFLFPVIVFSFYISRFNRSPSHYFLFLTPMYVIVISKFLYDVYIWLVGYLNSHTERKVNNRVLGIALLAIVLIPSVYITIKTDFYMSNSDTRIMAYKWVNNNLPDEKNSEFLYVYGENLEMVPFRKNQTKRVKKVDSDYLGDEGFPAYLIIGKNGVSYNDLTSIKMDSDLVKGDAEEVLRHSKLLLYLSNDNRYGPPIFIYKVNGVDVKE